jgi:hypothetical protein
MAWLALARERWWKNQVAGLECQIGATEARLRGYEKRPIRVLHKRRLAQLLGAWLVEALWAQHTRRQATAAARWSRRRRQQRAWGAWCEHVAAAAQRRVLSSKVQARRRQLRLATAWQAWLQAMALQQLRRQQLAAAARHHRQQSKARAWLAWAGRAQLHRRKRCAAGRWRAPLQARAFRAWRAHAAAQARQRLVLARAAARRQRRLLAASFGGWQQRVADKQLGAQLSQHHSLQDQLARLCAENERLRRDNERFVRLVDSGEWTRGRVAELTAAGEVLRAERDALLALVGALRREFEAAAAAREAQTGELRGLIRDKLGAKVCVLGRAGFFGGRGCASGGAGHMPCVRCRRSACARPRAPRHHTHARLDTRVHMHTRRALLRATACLSRAAAASTRLCEP